MEFWPLLATKCSTSTPSSSTPIWFRSACWRTTIVRSTASRRARNSDSERIAGRRRPGSPPSARAGPATSLLAPVAAALALGLEPRGALDALDLVVARALPGLGLGLLADVGDG